MIRFFVLVIAFSVLVYLVLRLVRRVLGYGKNPLGDLEARTASADSGLDREHNECELVACARCGSFTPIDSAIRFKGNFYCSKDCLPN